MRSFKKLCIAAVTVFLLLAAALNIVLIRYRNAADGQYRVEAKRIADEITETGSYDPAKYPHITGVCTGDDLYKSDAHYVIIEANGTLYRAEYTSGNTNGILIAVNCAICMLFLLM